MNTSEHPLLPEFNHLPQSIDDAKKDFSNTVDANNKVLEGFYANKLLLIVGLPKSASSVIAKELSNHIGLDGKYASYMLNNMDSELRPEIAKDFPNGGVLKYHPYASAKNLKVIQLLKLKYVITLRHPLDQITSFLLHIGKAIQNLDTNHHYIYQTSDFKKKYILDFFHIIDLELFSSMNIDERLCFLIEDGYLFKQLQWTVDWLMLRDKHKSMIIKYEDFFQNCKQVIRKFNSFWGIKESKFLNIRDPHSFANKYANKRKNEEGKYYIQGWTGKTGTWKDYFSDNNKLKYDKILNNFLKSYPNATKLLSVYPNLFDV